MLDDFFGKFLFLALSKKRSLSFNIRNTTNTLEVILTFINSKIIFHMPAYTKVSVFWCTHWFFWKMSCRCYKRWVAWSSNRLKAICEDGAISSQCRGNHYRRKQLNPDKYKIIRWTKRCRHSYSLWSTFHIHVMWHVIVNHLEVSLCD